MSADNIVIAAGMAYKVAHRGMIGRGRRPHYVKARAAASFALRRLGMSYPQIARRLGRHHSTIINYVQAHSDWLAEPAFAGLVDQLSAMPLTIIPHPRVPKPPKRKPRKSRPLSVILPPERLWTPPERWCSQCERRVRAEEQRRCAGRYCALKAADRPGLWVAA